MHVLCILYLEVSSGLRFTPLATLSMTLGPRNQGPREHEHAKRPCHQPVPRKEGR